MKQPFTIFTNVLTALLVHGAITLAAKHPELSGVIKADLDEILTMMERQFEHHGLEKPEVGWRGVV